MFEEKNFLYTGHSIILGLNQCIETHTCNIRSMYSHYFVSTYIEPILNFIEENENI